MTTEFQITIDCSDPAALAAFWAETLGYEFADPPEGSASWEEWLQKMGVPEEEWDPGARPYNALVDPAGRLPRIWFQRVPEPKITKNRLHFDLNVSTGRTAPIADRKRRVDAEVDRLLPLGARRVSVRDEEDHYFVVMQDPEGNEFCVA